jgi:hypothetical protein
MPTQRSDRQVLGRPRAGQTRRVRAAPAVLTPYQARERPKHRRPTEIHRWPVLDPHTDPPQPGHADAIRSSSTCTASGASVTSLTPEHRIAGSSTSRKPQMRLWAHGTAGQATDRAHSTYLGPPRRCAGRQGESDRSGCRAWPSHRPLTGRSMGHTCPGRTNANRVALITPGGRAARADGADGSCGA